MNVLLVDDRAIIGESICSHLKSLGITCQLTTKYQNAKTQIEIGKPETILLNLDLKDNRAVQLIFFVRNILKSNVPILGITNQESVGNIFAYYNVGLSDHVVRPINFAILALKLLRFSNYNPSRDILAKLKDLKIHTTTVGIVIPCYNEGARINQAKFIEFIEANAGYHLCFVNDGSSDNTLEVLNNMRVGRENIISVLDLEENQGKAEAVRQGALHLCQDPQFDSIGFLDADLATDFDDLMNLVDSLNKLDHMMVVGSRIHRMGANIHKTGKREFISKAVNKIIRAIIRMPFQDTQCGAKVMTADLTKTIFQRKFKTSWLFDIELFMRMKRQYPKMNMNDAIYEYPLNRWEHVDGSKLSSRDALKIFWQLFKVHRTYG